LKKGKGGTTVDFGISVIRAILKAEQRKGLLSHNPAEAVECVNQGAETRECFTEQQIKDLWGVASDECKVMILLGGDYGLRLADASCMTWEQVNLETETFTYLPSKTANRRKDSLVREMTPQLKEVIERLPRGVGKGFLLPSLAGKKSGSHGGLSNEFSRLMEKAGIKVPKGVKKRGVGRQFRKLGYHSLKHSAISRMAEAGIPEEQRRALVGGHSKAVHDRYTHTSKEARSAARAKMRPLI
jgi:integrase